MTKADTTKAIIAAIIMRPSSRDRSCPGRSLPTTLQRFIPPFRPAERQRLLAPRSAALSPRLLALILALSLGAAGCLKDRDNDQRGTFVNATGTWTGSYTDTGLFPVTSSMTALNFSRTER